jgi:hypothetical protein
MRPILTLIAVLLALPAAGSGASRGKELLVGAAEDASKQQELVVAHAKMTLAARAGMSAIRVTASWNPGVVQLDGGDLLALQDSATAAQQARIRLFVSIAPRTGSSYRLV